MEMTGGMVVERSLDPDQAGVTLGDVENLEP
jgi:hypothetical protein